MHSKDPHPSVFAYKDDNAHILTDFKFTCYLSHGSFVWLSQGHTLFLYLWETNLVQNMKTFSGPITALQQNLYYLLVVTQDEDFHILRKYSLETESHFHLPNLKLRALVFAGHHIALATDTNVQLLSWTGQLRYSIPQKTFLMNYLEGSLLFWDEDTQEMWSITQKEYV